MTVLPMNGSPVTDAGDIDQVIKVLRQHVLSLYAEASHPPSRVHAAARGIVVEVDWAPITTASPAAPAQARQDPSPTPATDVVAQPSGPEQDTFVLSASTVGVFYRAPEPGAAPFVAEGDVITPGQQVAIVEAMKLMIPVEAERGGQIVEVLVADGTPVEHGEPLFVLARSDEAAQ